LDTAINSTNGQVYNAFLCSTPQAVSWTGGVNVSVMGGSGGNTIKKTGGSPATWDAGAVSTQTITSSDGAGMDQASEDVTSTNCVVSNYHTDQLGSVRALTNSAGQVVATYDYDAYGKPTSTGSPYNPFDYTGQYTDNESGLVYLRARYYDPSTQQFISVDPMA